MPSSNVALAMSAGLAVVATTPAAAADHTVAQQNRTFAVTRLAVSVGDTVKFVNLDDVPHNAFSLSKSNSFDTGMLLGGKSKDVMFTRPGHVEVECAVHPAMTMTVEVRP